MCSTFGPKGHIPARNRRRHGRILTRSRRRHRPRPDENPAAKATSQRAPFRHGHLLATTKASDPLTSADEAGSPCATPPPPS